MEDNAEVQLPTISPTTRWLASALHCVFSTTQLPIGKWSDEKGGPVVGQGQMIKVLSMLTGNGNGREGTKAADTASKYWGGWLNPLAIPDEEGS